MTVLKVDHLKRYFGTTKAVDDISFSLEEGEIVGFLGPNGAGKTTTIETIMDFIRPNEGNIEIFGEPSQNNSFLKSWIGYVAAESNLYKNWTGSEHISFIDKARGKSENAAELVKRLGFDASKKIRTHSTGNKQKLSLILALAHHPRLLILDEPTTGLDPLLQNTIYDILYAEAKNGTTVFMSSHNLNEVDHVCDRVIMLRQGKIIDSAEIEELRTKRLYTVNITFADTMPKELTKIEGVHLINGQKEDIHRAKLNVKGDINLFLKSLAKYNIQDLEIKHADLEDVFMEFYESPK